MDSNTGTFLEEDDERVEAWMQRIEVGEVVKIKGEELEVVLIGRHEITLKLLSFEDRARKELAKVSAQRDEETFEELAAEESKRHLKNLLDRQK